MFCINKMQKSKYLFFSVVLFLGVIFLFYHGTQSVFTQERQRDILENAIYRDIIACYALNGQYPESLDQLEQAYGLTYNKNIFFIDYRVQGANIMPDVTIIEKGDQ